MSQPAEVLIIGAGPAGSALAYFLAQAGRDVLLIDKAEFPRDKTCGDGLTPRALGVLRHLGLLERITDLGCRIAGIHLFTPDGRCVSSPIPPHGDLPRHVVVLPRYQLDDALRAHAVAAGARFLGQVEALELLRDGDTVAGAHAKSPTGPVTLRARQTVLATGAAAGLLDKAGLLAAAPQYGRAARGYYEGLGQVSDYIEFHLESVPLPGYGWVFPISATAANVGAGYFVRPGQARPSSPRRVLDEFIANPLMKERVARARVVGAIKGYPLRFDFPTTRLAYPGLVVIGEAAGLVNPLTGEGIDYALESAEVAAQVLIAALQADSSPSQTETRYTTQMRARFQKAFLTIGQVRDFYFKPWLLNRAGRAARRHPDFCATLVNVCLGNVDPGQGLSPKMIWQLVRG
ncbi:MAG: NAD(P)/FAD-dependent oxidoreductase [Anaerolineales bacterium]|nr:NAD(P)/FAD-dependent oxidoreductase [Anaerolineales bacterium]